MRNPVRNAALFGLATVVSIVLVLLGAMDMRETGRTGSPLLALGLFPALLCPVFFVHYWSKIRVFRELYNGRSVIARWTVPADQFHRFCEEEQRIPAGSVMTNFYKPPRTIPAAGLEVIFGDDGVLIGGGYFPLSATCGRRLHSVRYLASRPPSIEFGMVMNTTVHTSSATVNTYRTEETLRVPVATDATAPAGQVVRRYQAIIDGR
ncbi:hypothetical protein M8A51_15290 [Schlegelella sp. S2-27]|uniref:SMODS-associating 2TM beta-strand rich effector domain-containing protein n=1 Tax=Caldimonas mangrovi TaxID=2944811 RepID=A0ABT0YQ74_9BURK|nr:hypothetical protein [Caldimonas mangrovi]MCM5680889.1 hypothetical protein [Caldimonas mangrovi]